MINELLKKLEMQVSYEPAELAWLLDNIGHPCPEIRDELVYGSFCQAILGEKLEREQIKDLLDTILDKKLLFYQIEQKGQATLTRSFTALLLALLIDVDGQEQSPYHAIFSKEQREEIFAEAILYLEKEQDMRGYDAAVGWVHAFAHGADFLLHASFHPDFSYYEYGKIWRILVTKLESLPRTFTAGEETRLARVFQILVYQKKLPLAPLLNWVATVDMTVNGDREYLAKLNLYQFLTALFIQLKTVDLLSAEAEKAFLEKLSDFVI